MDIFLPSQDLNLVDDIEASLSVGERCILHKMISSTVGYRERGDENVVCSEVIMPRQTPGANNYTRYKLYNSIVIFYFYGIST